jgi:hypothetical protein
LLFLLRLYLFFSCFFFSFSWFWRSSTGEDIPSCCHFILHSLVCLYCFFFLFLLSPAFWLFSLCLMIVNEQSTCSFLSIHLLWMRGVIYFNCYLFCWDYFLYIYFLFHFQWIFFYQIWSIFLYFFIVIFFNLTSFLN